MSDEGLSEAPPTSPEGSPAESEDDFMPFNRTPQYPHEVKIYFGVLAGLLISAHLGFTSVWWVFVWSIGVMIPGEVKKVHTYGFVPYVNKLHFDRPSWRDIGVVVGGLVVVFLVLAVLIFGFMQLDMFLSEPGESILSTAEDGSVEGGHLLSNAVMNWWIYGIGVIVMFLIIGPAEELMFRHELQSGLKKWMPSWKAILFTNIVFALFHLPVLVLVPNVILMLLPLTGIFVLGSIFSLQYELTDNLLVPSVTHSIYNSIILTVLLIGVA